MLTEFQKTPADLGVSWDRVDPLWDNAVFIIHAARVKEENFMARSGK